MAWPPDHCTSWWARPLNAPEDSRALTTNIIPKSRAMVPPPLVRLATAWGGLRMPSNSIAVAPKRAAMLKWVHSRAVARSTSTKMPRASNKGPSALRG